MLHFLWIGMMLTAVIVGSINGKLHEVTVAVENSAIMAINLAIMLAFVSSIWLGIMKIAENAGLVKYIAKLLRPALSRIFPEIPPEHPAMGAMILNISATMLGLNNAATPFGLRAMTELEKLNSCPGIASNAMCTFLAIKTANEQVIPITAMALLAGAGAIHPGDIIPACLLTSACALTFAITLSKFLQRVKPFKRPVEASDAIAHTD